MVESRIWYGIFFAFFFLLPITSMPLVVKLVGSDVVAAPSGILLTVILLLYVLPRLISGNCLPDNAIPLICFVIVSLIATLISFFYQIPEYKHASVYSASLSAVLTLLIGFGFYLASSLWAQDENRLRFTLRVLNWSGFIVLFWTFLQAVFWYSSYRYPDWMKEIHFFLSIGPLYRQRFVGFTLEPSWLAHQLNLLYLPLWFASTITGFTAHRRHFGWLTFERFLFLSGVGILYLTLSRVGLVAFLLTAAFFVFKSLWKRRSGLLRKSGSKTISILVILIFILMILALLVFLGWTLSKLDYRMANLFQLDLRGRSDPLMYLAEKLSLAARFVYWDSGFKIFNQFPLLGTGLGHAGFYMPNTLSAYALKLVEVRDLLFRSETLLNIKSLWIRILAETGIIGFSFFFTWILNTWIRAKVMTHHDSRLKQTIGWMGCFVLIAFLLEGFSLDTFALPYLWTSTGIISSVKPQRLSNSLKTNQQFEI